MNRPVNQKTVRIAPKRKIPGTLICNVPGNAPCRCPDGYSCIVVMILHPACRITENHRCSRAAFQDCDTCRNKSQDQERLNRHQMCSCIAGARPSGYSGSRRKTLWSLPSSLFLILRIHIPTGSGPVPAHPVLLRG